MEKVWNYSWELQQHLLNNWYIARQKISKNTEKLNNKANHHNLIEIYRPLHSTTAEHTFFSSTYKTLTKIDNILGHKTIISKFFKINIIHWLPSWCSGWESACQCRGHGFEPWSGKIPHAAEQLGPWATTTEPMRLEPVLHNKRGRNSERPVHRDEEWPLLATTRESPHTETKTQNSQK